MALTPEQKMQVIAELQSRSDTTPAQRKKLGELWVKSLQKTEQGLIPQDPVQTITKGAEAAGMRTAEVLGEKGANPYVAATAGLGIAMAPDMLMGMGMKKPAVGVAEDVAAAGKAGLAKAGQVVDTLRGPSMEEAKAMGQAAERAFQPEAAKKAAQYTKQLIEPAKQELRGRGQRLSDLPGQTADKLKTLQEILKMHGAEMGAAEDVAGFGFKSTPEFEAALKNPKTMQDTLKTAADFARQGAARVAETVDPKTIQMVRKLAQEGGDGVSNLGNATLQQGREVAGKALGLLNKRFGQARSQYQEVADAIKALPADQKRMADMLKSQLKAAQNKLAEAKDHTKELMEAAKTADKARFADIRKQSLDLLRKGVEHDQMVRRIKETLGGIGAAGAAAFGYKKLKG